MKMSSNVVVELNAFMVWFQVKENEIKHSGCGQSSRLAQFFVTHKCIFKTPNLVMLWRRFSKTQGESTNITVPSHLFHIPGRVYTYSTIMLVVWCQSFPPCFPKLCDWPVCEIMVLSLALCDLLITWNPLWKARCSITRPFSTTGSPALMVAAVSAGG